MSALRGGLCSAKAAVCLNLLKHMASQFNVRPTSNAMRQLKSASQRPLLKALAFWWLLIPQTASANPAVSLQDQISIGALIGLTIFAMALELLVTAVLLVLICDVERRVLLACLLLLLNILTFVLFIVFLYPLVRSVVVIELLIWSAEALLIVQITRWLGEKPIVLRRAFVVAFVGNLFSFLVGLSA
ncbi:MAG: hypothetical protein ACKV19_04340 [Verrucomicrobiales bacterium]